MAVRRLSMDNKAAKPNMALIRELREASGAPVVDCKNALEVSNRRTESEKAGEADAVASVAVFPL